MRRTAITGIGVVAPGGVSRDTFWHFITSGQTATRPITFFDASGFRSQIAAECRFDPYAAGLDDQEIARMDRHVQFAVVSADEAMRDSELNREYIDRDRLGVILGTAFGAAMSLEEGYLTTSNRGREWTVDPDYATPFLYRALLPSTLASEVALRLGANGHTTVISNGFTSGIDAVGYAHELIQEGDADIVVAGGSEASISPICMAAFDPIKATSHRNNDPEHASRPFDRDRDGFVMGEGAAVLVLEEMTHAQGRNARIYAEIVGFASRADAYHMTGLKAGGSDLAEAIRESLFQGNVKVDDVDYISAHGSATKQNDRHETAAFKKSLGEKAYRTPISAIKSMIGHAMGASGAIELAATTLVIETGVIPPTANLEHADAECDLDYTPKSSRKKDVAIALSVNSSFGGLHSAMVLSRPGRA
jgi:3-oxoacyl-(acyl-carrier-protein) synthase